MARYHFVTTFEVPRSREEVWEVLHDPGGWASWWRWLDRVDVLDPGDRDGVGARHRYTFRTPLRYTLSFETEVVRTQRPARIEARATGELSGIGRWELTDTGVGTRLVYTWIVATTTRWMNLLAPLARPLFAWNHDVLMRAFAHGLAAQLDTRPSRVASRTLRAPRRLPERPATPPRYRR